MLFHIAINYNLSIKPVNKNLPVNYRVTEGPG